MLSGSWLPAHRGCRSAYTHLTATVSLAQHEDLIIDRLKLFHDVRSTALTRQVQADYAQSSPTTEVKLVEMNLASPWDFGEAYTALYDGAAAYPV